MPLTGDLAHNPGMCPDWESNQWPFGLQASAQSTELHQPGLNYFLIYNKTTHWAWAWPRKLLSLQMTQITRSSAKGKHLISTHGRLLTFALSSIYLTWNFHLMTCISNINSFLWHYEVELLIGQVRYLYYLEKKSTEQF